MIHKVQQISIDHYSSIISVNMPLDNFTDYFGSYPLLILLTKSRKIFMIKRTHPVLQIHHSVVLTPSHLKRIGQGLEQLMIKLMHSSPRQSRMLLKQIPERIVE